MKDFNFAQRRNPVAKRHTAVASLAEPDFTVGRTAGNQGCMGAVRDHPAAATEAFQVQMQQIDVPSFYELVSRERDDAYLVVGCHQDDVETVQEILKEFSFNRHNLNQFTGTIAGNLAECEQKAAELEKRRAEVLSVIEAQLSIAKLSSTSTTFSLCDGSKTGCGEISSHRHYLCPGRLAAGGRCGGLRRLGRKQTFALQVREPLPEEKFPCSFGKQEVFCTFRVCYKTLWYTASYGIDPTLFRSLFHYFLWIVLNGCRLWCGHFTDFRPWSFKN